MRILVFFLLLSLSAQAQLCQGALGDPVVHIDFGAGANNPGAPLPPGKTNYTYTTSCPLDGLYTIVRASGACFGGWHPIPQDHTGNPNGYMMLVNAASAPGVFYQDTVDLACTNVSYEFAAWIMNVNNPGECGGNPSRPNLTFYISRLDGTVIQTYASGDIPATASPIWKQFGFFFSLPSGINKVVLKIVNNAPGGCGNDLALDDITFRPCGPVVSQQINGVASSRLDLCRGTTQQVQMQVNVDPTFVAPAYQWQVFSSGAWVDLPGATFSQLPFAVAPNTVSGEYKFRAAVMKPENVGVVSCRTYSAAFSVWVHDLPAVTSTTPTPVCEGLPLLFTASGGLSYTWTGPSAFQSSSSEVLIPISSSSNAGFYTVTGLDQYGCAGTATVNAIVLPKPSLTLSPVATTVCEGSIVNFTASGAPQFLWPTSVGSSASVVAKDSIDSYLVGVGSNGCKDSVPLVLYVNKKPKVNAGPDGVIVVGQQWQMKGVVLGDVLSYSWSPGAYLSDPSSLQALAAPPVNTEYVLEASSALCGDVSDTVKIIVLKDLFVPDAFSPNGDGRNDRWNVLGLGLYKDFSVYVFNRYGQQVFYSNTAGGGWDGRFQGLLQPAGVFVYLIRLPLVGVELKGTVMLVR